MTTGRLFSKYIPVGSALDASCAAANQLEQILDALERAERLVVALDAVWSKFDEAVDGTDAEHIGPWALDEMDRLAPDWRAQIAAIRKRTEGAKGA